jgi:CMP-N,N'-diacetyllegionaminic acid synthase
MIGAASVLALIPARGGSKGLPRKNVRPLAGKPLVAWPVAAAKASASVDRVIVSTDDAEIARAATAAGADVPFMRPAEFAGDTATSMQVIRHALETLAARGERYDYLLLLEPTSPLTEASDIDTALQTLHASRERADAIVGISRVEAAHPEYDVRVDADGLIRPYAAPDFRSLRRRQEIEELYFLEGSLYASASDVLLERGGFHHERTLGYRVPRWKSHEIDEFVDFICVEAIMTRLAEIKANEPR